MQLSALKFFGVLSVILFISTPAVASLMNSAKITIRVYDEAGKPVAGAAVGIGFGENSTRHEIPVDGITGTDGTFSASESCNGYVGFSVTKNGYYKSVGCYNFNKHGSFRWEPWNPIISIPLRKIENPVPMYAWSFIARATEIPVADKDVGFDLTQHDWVKPYGVML